MPLLRDVALAYPSTVSGGRVSAFDNDLGIPLQRREEWRRPSIGPPIAAAQIAVTSVMAILLALRLYSRKFVQKALGIDDWFLLVGALATVALVGLNCYMIYNLGVGKDWYEYMLTSWLYTENSMKYVYISLVMHSLAVFFVKLSFLFFMRRLLPFEKPTSILNIMTALIILTSATWIFITIFQCWPIETFWSSVDLDSVQGKCLPGIILMNRVIPISNAVMDICIWALPVPAIWKLPVSLKEKFGILAMLGVGAMAITASICRAVYESSDALANDSTYHTATIGLYTAMEPLLGIICAALFSLRPLYKRYFSPNPTANASNTIRSEGRQSSRNRGGGAAGGGTDIKMSTRRDGSLDSERAGEGRSKEIVVSTSSLISREEEVRETGVRC